MAPSEGLKIIRRDWLALAISFVSLGMSGLTVYFNILLRTDDVRLVLLDDPVGLYRSPQNELFSDGRQRITILNAGSRAVAVTEVSVTAYKRGNEKEKLDECKTLNEKTLSIPIPFESNPAVIKPGDIQVIEEKVMQLFWEPSQNGLLKYKFMESKPGDYYLLCMEINLTTPDGPVVHWQKPLYMMTKQNQLGVPPKRIV